MTSPAHHDDSDKTRISLRERKFARTKYALLQAALEGLRHKRLDEIPVKEICEQVEVSEATFFNYFPKKEDLLRYFIQIWIVELYWRAKDRAGENAGLEFVDAVFDFASERLKEYPRVIMEVISYMAQQSNPARCPKERNESKLTLAERMQALPQCCGVEPLPEPCLDELFRPPLERAVQQGQLRGDVDIDAAMLSLLSTFVGVPFWLGAADCPSCIGSAYRKQLQVLWRGLGNR